MLGRQVDGPTRAAKPARPSARRVALWSCGIGAVALAAGLAWMAHVDGTESAAAAAAWSVNGGAKPAALATADAAPGAEPEAGAAARINDEAAAGGSAALTASLEKENPQTLREMLSAKPAPTPAPGAGVDILSKALASPSASEPAKTLPKAKPKAPPKDEARSRTHDIKTAARTHEGKAGKAGAKAHGDKIANKTAATKHNGKLAAKAAPSKTREARLAKLRAHKAQQTLLAAKGARHGHAHGQGQGQALAKKSSPPATKVEPDSDVTLLAALVAHAQANPPDAAGTTQARLKQCKPMKNNADAEQCRAQVCAGRWKSDADCKALPSGQEPLAKSS